MPYASRTGTRRNLAALRAAGWRLLVSATGVLRHEGFPFGLDNGAWTAHQRGTPFDEVLFERALAMLGAAADWGVVPDIVGGGLRSLEFSLNWLARVRGSRQHRAPDRAVHRGRRDVLRWDVRIAFRKDLAAPRRSKASATAGIGEQVTDEIQPKNTITNDELAWLSTGTGPMPPTVSQRESADIVKEMATELLERRRGLTRERSRAKQVQKLRWSVENLLVKVERLDRDAPVREPAIIPTLVWPRRDDESRPTIWDLLLEAQSAGLLAVTAAELYGNRLFEEQRVRLDGAVVRHSPMLLYPHHEGQVVEVSPPGAPKQSFRWVMS